MPAILSHYSFALPFAKDTLYPEAMLVGSQGPDPFFFFGQVPLKNRPMKNEVDQFGRDLHHIDVTPVYYALIEYAKVSKDKDLLFSYIKGLFLHFSLDRACHPFVFPRAGFSSDPKTKMLFSAAHCLYETMVDSLISNKKGTYTTRPQKCLRLKKDEALAISKMWDEANKKTLKNRGITERSFFYSLLDYRSSLRMTNTPHLFSKLFVLTLLGPNSLPTQMNIPRRIPKKYKDVDFLNLKKSPYKDYITGENRTDSWMDDEEKAREDSLRAFTLLDKAYKGEEEEMNIKAFVDDYDHDGTKVGAKMVYIDPVWPEYKKSLEKKTD